MPARVVIVVDDLKFAIELERLLKQLESLTPRESEIIDRLLAGQRRKEVADDLGINVTTVHTHLRRLFRKHGVHSWRSFVRKVLTPHPKKP